MRLCAEHTSSKLAERSPLVDAVAPLLLCLDVALVGRVAAAAALPVWRVTVGCAALAPAGKPGLSAHAVCQGPQKLYKQEGRLPSRTVHAAGGELLSELTDGGR